MKNTGFIAAILALGVSVTAVSAWAQGPGGKHGEPMTFQSLDTDGNGEITQQELAGRRDARFAETDANGDGMLDREEMIAAGQKRMQDRVDSMIERFDSNKDGVLSKDELPNRDDRDRAGRMFDHMDRDENGSISEEEFEEARNQMKNRWGGHKGGHKMRHYHKN